jgi:hypothetical protein
MSVTTQQFIDLIGSETEALDKTVGAYLLDSTALISSILLHSWLLYTESKQLLKSVKKNDLTVVIDSNDEMTDSLKRGQVKIKSIYNSMGDVIKKSRRPNLLKISRWLLKKSFDNYDLAIINIMEHDVDADDTTYSEPFDSVDDLMKQLNS